MNDCAKKNIHTCVYVDSIIFSFLKWHYEKQDWKCFSDLRPRFKSFPEEIKAFKWNPRKCQLKLSLEMYCMYSSFLQRFTVESFDQILYSGFPSVFAINHSTYWTARYTKMATNTWTKWNSSLFVNLICIFHKLSYFIFNAQFCQFRWKKVNFFEFGLKTANVVRHLLRLLF